MRSYTAVMSTNRPTPSVQIVAIAATLALIVTTFVIALAAFAAGAYPHRHVEGPSPAAISQAAEAAGEGSADLLDQVGRGGLGRPARPVHRPRRRLEGLRHLSQVAPLHVRGRERRVPYPRQPRPAAGHRRP